MNKTSRILIAISLVGFLLSLIGFYILENQSLDNLEKMEVGKITRFENDTRLKRSENIHWYPINQTIKCYTNDLIFTGPESKALIELSNGARIQLYENSLISLSEDLISLESGVIEIDLSGAKGMKLESFGKKIPLKAESRVKIQQDKSGNKVTPLNEKATELLQNPALKTLATRIEEVNIVDPLPGTQFPHVPGHKINLKWKSTSTNKAGIVSFYTQNKAEPFLTKTSPIETLEIGAEELPAGPIKWNVKLKNGVVSKTSDFTLSDKTKPTLLLPQDKSTYPFPDKNLVTQHFEWSSLFSFPFKFQLSKDRNFLTLANEIITQAKFLDFDIKEEGNYYWRVGQEFIPGTYLWSDSSEFVIRAAAPPAPINIKIPAPYLDFAINSQYLIEIIDPNKASEYLVTISQNNTIISQMKLKSTKFPLQKLENGKYTIKVTGTLKSNKQVTGQEIFEVKNSPALKAPKIIKKKKKLFVQIFKSVLDLLFPSALAQEEGDGIVELSWEDTPGTSYEIEIYDENKKLLTKRLTDKSDIKFKVGKPGTYLWRVRSKFNNRWSPFSDFEEIEAADKVSLITSPLMKSPSTNSSIELAEKNNTIPFSWDAPYPEFKYYLELFARETDTKPFKIYKLTGNQKNLKFKNTPSTFWWRVVAESKYSNRSANLQKYKFSIIQPPPGLFFINTNLLYSMTNYKQQVDSQELEIINSNHSLSGPTLDLYSEFWPGKWNKEKGFAAGFQLASLSSGANKFSSMEFVGEFGKKFKQTEITSHTGFIGFHYLNCTIDVGEVISANIDVPFASARYVFSKIINPKYSTNFNAEMLLALQSDFVRPTFKLKQLLNYHWKENALLNLVFEFRNRVITAPYEEDSLSGDLTVTTQDLSIGFGATWLHD